MVGVSNPIMRADPREGWRFLAGFGAGLAAAALTLLGPLLLLAWALELVHPTARTVLLIAVLLGFGAADLLNRTPHVWRQVPQRFARELQPGRLGLIWAYDLGLLVTTQKTTSLLWIGLAGAVLVGPPSLIAATAFLVVMLFGLGVAVATLMRNGAELTGLRLSRRIGGVWVVAARRVSGLIAIVLAIVEAVRLLWG
ncbi:hypothetical protein AB0C02_30830 [Micromonospora sp. NPDC048999]|uniref:hypothetical protein n=1 Tax=Micromonospora sp. NPDC048999 TaxID=3155391 RepID=UPI0033C04C83